MAFATALDPSDLEFGKSLWRLLQDQRAFEWDGIFWLLDQTAEQWHLVVVTPLLDKSGPKKAYTDLRDITKHISVSGDQLLRITLMSPTDHLYESLRSVFSKAKNVEGVRLGNTFIGNTIVPEAYLYEVR